MWRLILAALAVASSTAFVAAPTGLASVALARSTAEPAAPTVMMARRRNTKLEKRKRNEQNMRKFKKIQPKVGGRKAPSRKKLALKAASLKEKERESQFVAKLYQVVEGFKELTAEETRRFSGIGSIGRSDSR